MRSSPLSPMVLTLATALFVASPLPALAADLLSPAPDWSFESDSANARLGWHVESAGDVNGDGFDDVIQGAYSFTNGQSAEGAAFLHFGSTSGPSLTADWIFECDQAGAQCGWSVSSAGDVNGDGFDDVLVGSRLYDAAFFDEGAVFLFMGSPSGPATVPSWSFPYGQAGAISNGVSGLGDVNGDGFDDFAAVSPDYTGGQVSEGRVMVFHGSASGPGATPDWTYESNQSNTRLGQATTAGDVNGDSFNDLLVGALAWDNGQTDEGGAWVFLGSSSGLDPAPIWSSEGDQSFARFGLMVNTAGDVNGDGFDDVIIAAEWYDNPEPTEGGAFVFLGGPAGLIMNGIKGSPANADWSVEGDQNGALLRWGDTAGDVNGDGFDDVIVGSPHYDTAFNDAGRARVFLGSSLGLSASAAWTAFGDRDLMALGFSTESAGDVNGDGLPDVIVGAVAYANGQTREGAAFVYLAQGDPVCLDGDGDGYGTPGSPACAAGGQEDCDDVDPFTHPGAPELCDGVDNDCDLTVPEDELDLDADNLATCEGDCDDADPANLVTPPATTGLLATPSGNAMELAWDDLAAISGTATDYDIFTGLVSELRSGAGFAAGRCEKNNVGAATYTAHGPDPPLGDMRYYIVRGQNGCPAGDGSWGSPTRDSEVAASPVTCR